MLNHEKVLSDLFRGNAKIFLKLGVIGRFKNGFIRRSSQPKDDFFAKIILSNVSTRR